jgi:hypothetical protein
MVEIRKDEIYNWTVCDMIEGSRFEQCAPVKIILISNGGGRISFETLMGEIYTVALYHFNHTMCMDLSSMTIEQWDSFASLMRSE